jgi:hypothetical protein
MSTPRRRTVACHVGAAPADAGTVEALARLQLTARRRGLEISLREASSDLEALLGLCGLRDVLRVEPGGQPEEGEQRGGVQEERELDDPAP